MKQAWVQVSYSHRIAENMYGSGMTRMWAGEVAKWIAEQTKGGYPVLVTGIKVLTGDLFEDEKQETDSEKQAKEDWQE